MTLLKLMIDQSIYQLCALQLINLLISYVQCDQSAYLGTYQLCASRLINLPNSVQCERADTVLIQKFAF